MKYLLIVFCLLAQCILYAQVASELDIDNFPTEKYPDAYRTINKYGNGYKIDIHILNPAKGVTKIYEYFPREFKFDLIEGYGADFKVDEGYSFAKFVWMSFPQEKDTAKLSYYLIPKENYKDSLIITGKYWFVDSKNTGTIEILTRKGFQLTPVKGSKKD